MDFYSANLVGFVALNVVFAYFQRKQEARRGNQFKEKVLAKSAEPVSVADAAFARFQRQFLLVYLLVFAADWLQVCCIKCVWPFF